MSVTLGEYARHQYPGRSTDAWRGVNPPLLRHTVVAHVVGRERTERTIDLLEHSLETDDVAAVLVLGEEPIRAADVRRGPWRPGRPPRLAPAAGRLLGCVLGILVIVAVTATWHLPWEAGSR